MPPLREALFRPPAPPRLPTPTSWPYAQRLLARGFGHVGRWWSLMNVSDKAAFLDGFQLAAAFAKQEEQKTCEVIRRVADKQAELTADQTAEILFVCNQVSETK